MARERVTRVAIWVKRFKEAIAERRGTALAGRGWRAVGDVTTTGRRGVVGGYSEARPYRRREKEGETSADVRQRRVVWRRAGGAEMGLVMLRRIEGKLPMRGRTPWERTGVG